MLNWLRVWRERLFPERQLLLRTGAKVQSISVPGWLQAGTLACWVCAFGGAVYFIAGYFHAHHTIASRDAIVTSVALSKAETDLTLDQIRTEFSLLKGQYAALKAHDDATQSALETTTADYTKIKTSAGRAKTLEQELAAATAKAGQLGKTLEESRADLAKSETQRTTLQSKIIQLQSELQAAALRKVENSLSALGHEAPDSDVDQPEVSTAAHRIAPVAKLDGHADGDGKTSEFEKLLRAAGLDVNKLLGGLGSRSNEGGPFVALDAAKTTTMDPRRMAELQKLARTLPLSAPLDHYQLESSFGPRHDPINGRESFHDGLDMSAPYKSPVYSTGPGVVSFAGPMESYGKVVEVDHGHGIVTRYAHLHRILVARGQKVGAHTKIAELGSTGRSTGPHVHYEVLIDGDATDPDKFMQAGKNVVSIGVK